MDTLRRTSTTPSSGLAGDLLLVVVALLVPVVDARHRRVAPVDDLHVRGAVDEAALADHHVAGLPPFLEAEVREVRRLQIDRQRLAAAEPAAQRRQPGHLLDQRRQVLAARLGDLVAQRQQVAVDVIGAQWRGAHRPRRRARPAPGSGRTGALRRRRWRQPDCPG
jgi:hypothetical protein